MMCVSSAIGDLYRDSFPNRWPSLPQPPQWSRSTFVLPEVSRADFDALKAEVAELRKLLVAAKEYDAKTGQPECEQPEKIAFLKKVAEFVGIDLKDCL